MPNATTCFLTQQHIPKTNVVSMLPIVLAVCSRHQVLCVSVKCRLD